ncbi:GNAT family N-acetyltransferase [Bacillus sp. 1P06AnD]|uniref:GNAT family N-acetyltransferase n=1 Tax=Bacillus sp. 1P06AnD TaxID=3132208 RepID=UPI0039A29A6D
MTVIFRNNCDINEFGDDYLKIRMFLCRLKDLTFSYGRWDWMMKHGFLNKSEISRIGIWEDDGEIVAAVLYDSDLGNGHFCIKEGYAYLKEEMLLYAEKNLNNGAVFEAFISDKDLEFQRIAYRKGYLPTTNKECDAYFPIEERSLNYELPEGFRIASMADNYDVFKYGEVLFKGFDHEEENRIFTATEKDIEHYHNEFSAPNVNKGLKVIALDSNGEFAAYCGMWYDEHSEYGIVEPLVTIPKYRKMGLGKAVVYEGIKRCRELGAKSIFVGSSQQFYYSIGFIPYGNGTYWVKK